MAQGNVLGSVCTAQGSQPRGQKGWNPARGKFAKPWALVWTPFALEKRYLLLQAVPFLILTKSPYRLAVAMAKIYLLISTPYLKSATLSRWHHSIGKKTKDTKYIPNLTSYHPLFDYAYSLSPHYLWTTAKPPTRTPGRHFTDRSFLKHRYYFTTHLLKFLTHPESTPNPSLQITSFAI